MNQDTYIDLVLPVYQPQPGWAAETAAKKTQLERLLNARIQVIVSDDGSEDPSELHLLQRLCPDVILVKSDRNRGKGHALRAGFAQSHAPLAVFTDADFPYEPESMLHVVQRLHDHADVALGFRTEEYYDSVPAFRKRLSETFRIVLRRMLRFPITDTQCGLKGMNARGREVFLKTTVDRFLVDMEFIKMASRVDGLRVESVEVRLRPDVEFSEMDARVLLRELWNFIRIMLAP